MIRYISRVGTACSILINVILGGSSNQTFSARNYDLKRQNKPNITWIIDGIFFDRDHCLHSWSYWILRKDIDK